MIILFITKELLGCFTNIFLSERYDSQYMREKIFLYHYHLVGVFGELRLLDSIRSIYIKL